MFPQNIQTPTTEGIGDSEGVGLIGLGNSSGVGGLKTKIHFQRADTTIVSHRILSHSGAFVGHAVFFLPCLGIKVFC